MNLNQNKQPESKRSKGLLVGIIAGLVMLIVILCSAFGLLSGGKDNGTAQKIQTSLLETQQAGNPGNANIPINANSLPVDQLPVTAVVQIIAIGEQQWSGSGTIISADGLILTNYHVAVGDRFYQAEDLVVALTLSEEAIPEPTFYAEVVQADQALDLAVLRITDDMNGSPVNTAGLNLPYVSFGNSDDLRLGDEISILGYPDIGGQTITLTSGEVSGFTAESGHGNRAFIKTSATISGGNSGGLAVDRSNRIIGIPTQLGAGELEGEVVDCRALADTNRDGVIDDNDNCVPTGGFINALRPINLALPIINAAKSGQVDYQAEIPPDANMPTGARIIYKDDFSDNASGWPVSENPETSYSYQNGRYFIKIIKPYSFVYVTGAVNLRNTLVEIDAQPEGTSLDGEYGVICRYQDEDNYYLFSITQDGFYAIYKLLNGEWISLIDYTYSSFLEGQSQTRIKVSCVDDRLGFSVNGKLIGDVDDDTFYEGDYGFFVGTFETENNIISFDNLIVSQP